MGHSSDPTPFIWRVPLLTCNLYTIELILLECTVQRFLEYSQACGNITIVYFTTVIIRPQKPHTHKQTLLIVPFSNPLTTTNLLSVSLHLSLGGIRISEIIVFCGWLLSLSRMFEKYIRAVARTILHSFWLPNNIPLSEHTTPVYPFITRWTLELVIGRMIVPRDVHVLIPGPVTMLS